ncbi:MAG: CHAT domain-containing protein [Candidatus Omnitrophica bacterium]|nr:CHAT domain-containing protein [Candidatus Omnitrophota bacterium]
MFLGNSNTLVLEIFRSENRLKMSVSEAGDSVRTVSHYSLCAVSFEDVSRVCQEIIAILNRQRKRSDLDPDSISSLKKHGQLLWEQLLTRSVKSKLKSTGSRDLVLSLEEELVSIPWELLYDGSEFLALKFNVGRLICSQQEQAQPRSRNITGKPRMLILADPTADLKGAYEEGINIRNQFDKAREKVSIDFKSTDIDTLFVKKALREYDIVHFAGHCEYEKSDPQKTGWLLRDGRFTTSDILAMGADTLMPSLVFSNACQSAQVNKAGIDQDYQEKTYSLASAFLFSGVRHYVGVIQRIEDPVSLVFAREFYLQLLKGNSVGKSIRLSRLRLIKDYGVNSCLWAGYILYGDPDFVLFPGEPKAKFSSAKTGTGLYRKHKRKLLVIFLSLLFAALLVSAAVIAPSLNPTAYYLFKKSQGLFKAGKNAQVISITRKIISKYPGFLDVYPFLADSYFRQGKKDEALKYYFEYVLQSQSKNDFRHLADSYIMIGWFYHQTGLYPKAYEFYQKAVDLSRKNNDKLNEALVLRKLAVWHMDKEENDLALQFLTKSSEINRGKQFYRKYRYNLACDYFDLGLLFANKEDYNTAKEFYNKSLKVFNQLNLKNEVSDYYFNLGEIFVWEKEYQKALVCYLKGLKIDEDQGNLPSISSDYCMLGELYMEMDNLPQAEEYFKKAISLAKSINGRMELAAASFSLGRLYKTKNQKNLAREYLRQAQEIYYGVETPDYKSAQAELLSLDR